MYKVQYNLRAQLDKSLSRKLQDIRLSTERSRMKVEEWFLQKERKGNEFVKAFNTEMILFQEAVARSLKADQDKTLFGLKPGDTIILADPGIIKRVYWDNQ